MNHNHNHERLQTMNSTIDTTKIDTDVRSILSDNTKLRNIVTGKTDRKSVV